MAKTEFELPTFLTTFVGRASELDRLDGMYISGARFVTIVGTPGIGKTRLVIEYGHRLAQGRGEGVPVLVSLADVSTFAGACAEFCRVLELQPSWTNEQEWVDGIGRALGVRGKLTLILDGAEGLAETVVRAFEKWLIQAPTLRVLATSRERTGVEGESIFELRSLELTVNDAQTISPAGQLFLDRSRSAADIDWNTREALPVVEALVRELDGIPLAIELAAARTSVLSPKALLARMSERLDLFVRANPKAHGSMHAAIEASWARLTENEQRALARCAVFRGTFSVAAAEHVLRDGAADEDGSTLALLGDLRNRSLLTRAIHPRTGEDRFSLLRVIRQFAEEKLVELGIFEETSRRHALYFAALGRDLFERAQLRLDPLALGSIVDEEANFVSILQRAKLDPAHRTISREAVLGALMVLGRLCFDRGPIGAFGSLVESSGIALEEEVEGVDRRILAGARLMAAAAAWRTGRAALSAKTIERALEDTASTGDRATEGRLLAERAGARLFHNEREEFLADIQRARSIVDASDDPCLEYLVALLESQFFLREGDVERALDVRTKAVDAAQRAKLPLLEGRAILRQVNVLLALGDIGYATARLERAEGLLAGPNHATDAVTLFMLTLMQAMLSQEVGDFPRASERFDASLELARHTGRTADEALSLAYRGLFRVEAGDFAAAVEDLGSALALSPDTMAWNETMVLAGRAVAEAELGHEREAWARLEEAERKLDGARDKRAEILSAFRGCVEAIAARSALQQGDGAKSLLHEERAKALLAAAEAVPDQEVASNGRRALASIQRSADVRAAVRILRKILQPFSLPRNALIVSLDGEVLRPPKKEKFVSLRESVVLRKFLAKLIETHEADPESVVTSEGFLSAVYPDEAMDEKAARNRVLVNITKLRQLGMRDVLETHGDGWRFAPKLRIVRVDVPSDAPMVTDRES